VSDWDSDMVRFFRIGRQYYWVSSVYFELMVLAANKH